jgi:sulfide:quinone oxidoreductase
MISQGAGVIRRAALLVDQSVRSFAGFSNRKSVAKDLPKYDAVVVGANLGGIWTRHFDEGTAKGKFTTFCAYDRSQNEAQTIRNVYEQSRVSKTDYFPNAGLAFNKYTIHSGAVGVKQFIPEENAIVLKNGRRVEYEQLVIAMGLQDDVDAIEGLEDAWKDPNSKVFVSKDHPSWRSAEHKYQKYHYNYTHGDAFFCIPEYPFKGEIGAYNFLLSAEVWKWN